MLKPSISRLSHPAHAQPSRPESRPGFTVVEVLIAIIVLTVGALALAGSLAVALRRTHAAHAARSAAALAHSRMERTAALRCDARSSGQLTHGGFTETWTIEPAGGTATKVTVVVSRADSSPEFRLSEVVPCG